MGQRFDAVLIVTNPNAMFSNYTLKIPSRMELPVSPLSRRSGHLEHSAEGWAVARVQLCRTSPRVFEPARDRQRAGSSARVGTALGKGEGSQQDGI